MSLFYVFPGNRRSCGPEPRWNPCRRSHLSGNILTRSLMFQDAGDFGDYAPFFRKPWFFTVVKWRNGVIKLSKPPPRNSNRSPPSSSLSRESRNLSQYLARRSEVRKAQERGRAGTSRIRILQMVIYKAVGIAPNGGTAGPDPKFFYDPLDTLRPKIDIAGWLLRRVETTRLPQTSVFAFPAPTEDDVETFHLAPVVN